MSNSLKVGVLLLALVLASCSSLHSMRSTQELARGKSNFESGYYRDAFHQLLPLASEGNREAQYAIGYMYYYGYGVVQDMETGTFWIQKSADQRYQPAAEALIAMRKAQ